MYIFFPSNDDGDMHQLPPLLSNKKELDDAVVKLTLGHDLVGGRKEAPMAREDLNAFFTAARRKVGV
jgi:hypothetical protein